MKLKIYTFIFIVTMFSCKNKGDISLSSGYDKVQEKLLKKFGANAHYTDLSIKQNKNLEVTIDLLMTNNPSFYEMEGWNYSSRGWRQVSQVNLELSKGNIGDYMFQLNKEINIVEAGNLVALSKKKLKLKAIENTTLKQLKIVFPDDGDKSKMRYEIELESEMNKVFSFSYNLSGKLIID